MQVGQHLRQNLQQTGLFLVHRRGPIQAAPIPAHGDDDLQALEFLDQPPRSHLQPVLPHLPLQQAVGQQGQHVDEQHPCDALVLVQVDR